MNWIPRSYQELIPEISKQRPVLVLTGSRQVGKTSLLQYLFPDHSFVSLDLPSNAELAEKNPGLFLRKNPPPLVVDEVQYAPELFRHIKIEVDKQRDRNGQFILTGSQKFPLMKSVGDSLAGRTDILELETLSWTEINNHMPTQIEKLMFRGGFPELWQKSNLDRERFYSAYISSYLERDVKGLLNVVQLRDFERFLRACALRSGQLLNKAELAKDIGISPSTANAWLSVLSASGQIVLLEPWFSNKTKSLVKSPKIYLSDTGLLNFLLNIQSIQEMYRSPNIGQIWETFVFSELRKKQLKQKGTWKWWFWRDRSHEVDFIDDRGSRFHLFECKWTENPTKKDSKAILHVEQKLGAQYVDTKKIICRTPSSFPLDSQIFAENIEDLL